MQGGELGCLLRGTSIFTMFSWKAGYTQQREKEELGGLHGLPETTLEFTLNETGKKPNLLSDVLRGSHMK